MEPVTGDTEVQCEIIHIRTCSTPLCCPVSYLQCTLLIPSTPNVYFIESATRLVLQTNRVSQTTWDISFILLFPFTSICLHHRALSSRKICVSLNEIIIDLTFQSYFSFFFNIFLKYLFYLFLYIVNSRVFNITFRKFHVFQCCRDSLRRPIFLFCSLTWMKYLNKEVYKGILTGEILFNNTSNNMNISYSNLGTFSPEELVVAKTTNENIQQFVSLR